ncbi:putative WRKY transcription factor 67 [Dendrobium catenatum]|uniref:Putative WRKY transcription factor 67 n=2 Tax=Dendrobium catenatum TaxID=906689 RepID=A0A2I0WQZ4_9ASPA|nr:putative WRKY transcription factor 67 [Dendrobium catenatum]
MNCTEPCKRRRVQRWTILTSVPHFDGYEWRKYGEKNIQGYKFPRSYYKCTHNKDQGCPATKTIQQKEDNDCNPPKYEVIYSLHHICKTMGTNTHLDKKYSSAPINNTSSTTTTSSCQANSSQPLLTLVADQLCPMESMLLSAEPQIEENGGIENSNTKSSPSTDLDFDSEWAKWLLSCTEKA